MKGNSPLDLSGRLQKKRQEDRDRLQVMFDGQRRDFERHVNAAVSDIMKDIDRELQKIRKPYRKLQLRSWFLAMTAAGLVVIFQLALENIPLDRIGLKDWIWSLVQDGVVEITRDREGKRWLQMNVNWEPNREWITQAGERWYIRIE